MHKLLALLAIFTVSAGLHASTFYIDPQTGDIANPGTAQAPWSTLEEVIAAGYIYTQRYTTPYDSLTSVLVDVNADGAVRPGDTLVLHGGLHGYFDLTNAHNSDYITLMAGSGGSPILKGVKLTSGSKWNFDGLVVSSEPYGEYLGGHMMDLASHGWQGPVHDIKITNCFLYSTLHVDEWTLDDWLAKRRSGIKVVGSYADISGCSLLNIDFGISLVGSHMTALNCVVENFSGDGMRSLGPHQLLQGNVIKNCYNINDNHDDGIQSYNLGTYDTRDVVIRGNTIINYSDPDQPLRGPLQGIGCFDGPYTDWLIENNIVAVDHWHGISLYGAFNCTIRNNTVLDPTPDVTPGPSWIRINPNKDGVPSEGNTVANNICNTVQVEGALITTNMLLSDEQDYDEHFEDAAQYNFRLLTTSSAIDAGVDSLAAAVDFYNVDRPQGAHSDIGAIEYVIPVAVADAVSDHADMLYPNPTIGMVQLPQHQEIVYVYTMQGKLYTTLHVNAGAVDLSFVPEGMYILHGTQGLIGRVVVARQ